MYHPAIFKYVQLLYGEVIPTKMEAVVSNLRSALYDNPSHIDWVSWDCMSKATGLYRGQFADVYSDEAWTDPNFKAAIEAIVHFQGFEGKQLEDYL